MLTVCIDFTPTVLQAEAVGPETSAASTTGQIIFVPHHFMATKTFLMVILNFHSREKSIPWSPAWGRPSGFSEN